MSLAYRLFQAVASACLFVVCSACCCVFNLPAPAPQPTQAVSPVATTGQQEAERQAVAGQEGATIGRVTADVVSISIRKPKSVSSRGTEYEWGDERLILMIRFSTADQTLAAHYIGFNQFLSEVKAKDEFGNTLVHSSPSLSDKLVGESAGFNLRAGEPVIRAFMFEKPVAASKRVDIDFPASCVGEKGMYRFTVPLEQVSR